MPFHIGEGALEWYLPIQFSENKRFRKVRKTSIAVQVCTFKRGPHGGRLVYQMSNTLPSINTVTSVLTFVVGARFTKLFMIELIHIT